MARPLALARRFWLAYVALAAVLGASIGLFVLAVEKPGPKPPPPWSAWQPIASSPQQRQDEIARYVARQYHLPSGHQLVNVLVGPPSDATKTIDRVALAKTLTPQQRSDILGMVSANETAMYVLCGDQSAKCAISEGKPSKARGEVLRREALELALYTFRYVKEAQTVVTFFPPALGQVPSHALLFTRQSLSDQLKKPLRTTLPSPRAPLPGQLLPSEQRTVDGLTRFLKYAFEQDQNGSLVLVLAPDTA